MRALFSIFAAFFGVMIIMVAATPINMDTSISINKQELVKRELNKRSLKIPPLCRVAGLGGEAYFVDVQNTADELRNAHNHGTGCYVEKRNCGQVACSSTSQVLLCSELDHDATFSCADVATAVDTIDKYCTRQQTIWAPTYRVTQGQIFDTAGWNVVVRAKAGKC